MNKSIIIIPVHLNSKRFPNKAIQKVHGKTLLEWTFLQASKVENVIVRIAASHAICTTLNEHIENKELLNSICTTQHLHFCGTNRAAQALEKITHDPDDIVVVWQVDEPLVNPQWVETLIEDMPSHFGIQVSTLAAKLDDKDLENRNVVKQTNENEGVPEFHRHMVEMRKPYHHIGIYFFTARNLKFLASLPRSESAKKESLEQYSWIDAGFPVYTYRFGNAAPLSINVPEDFEKFESMIS